MPAKRDSLLLILGVAPYGGLALRLVGRRKPNDNRTVGRWIGIAYYRSRKVAKKIFSVLSFVVLAIDLNGCPGRDRTFDQVINSHLLCH